jgi:hypothetical protein
VCFADTDDEAAVGVGPFRYLLCFGEWSSSTVRLVVACLRPERPSLILGSDLNSLCSLIDFRFLRIGTPEHKERDMAMKDYLAQVEKLRKGAAECALIRDPQRTKPNATCLTGSLVISRSLRTSLNRRYCNETPEPEAASNPMITRVRLLPL